MKISIQEDPGLMETEILVKCREVDAQIMKMAASLRSFDKKVTGFREGQTFLLDAEEILYVDTADKRTFFYTAEGVYETPLRLYELEERLSGCGFFRASKSSIVNFDQIRSMRPDFGGRMRLTMTNGEAVYVSRQYVQTIKQKLGL